MPFRSVASDWPKRNRRSSVAYHRSRGTEWLTGSLGVTKHVWRSASPGASSFFVSAWSSLVFYSDLFSKPFFFFFVACYGLASNATKHPRIAPSPVTV